MLAQELPSVIAMVFCVMMSAIFFRHGNGIFFFEFHPAESIGR